ncbi:MAG: DUF11 domain-containing protein [Phycisphaeraceae bacterium]|nr:DUF11 domain-containing protein [Phycisphaeraceae bacterium]
MNIRLWRKTAFTAICAVGAMVLSGCSSDTHGGESSRWNSDAWANTIPRQAEPAPRQEPAPAPRRAAGCPTYNPPVGQGMTVSGLAFPTGNPATSAVQLHQVMPRQVRLGREYGYEIHVTNLTEGNLQNVLVTLENTDNQTVVSSVPSATRGPNNSTQWVIGDLGACKTQVIKVTARAEKVGTSSDCISVSYNNALCVATNVVEPAIAITKQAPAEVLLCDPINMRIEVRNTGNMALDNVMVKDTFPQGLTTTDGKSSVEVDLGTLAPGQAKQVNIAAKATRPGTYQNTATVASGDITATSNSTSTLVRQPTLEIAAECGTRTNIGLPNTCKFTVKNTGNGVAANTVVTAVVPANAQFMSADNNGAMAGGRVTWNVGSLNAGESRTFSMTVRTTGAGAVRCEASATAVCASAVSANCSFEVIGLPDIRTLLTDDDGVVFVGDPHILRYEVGNQGQVDLTNVRVVVTLPEGMEFVATDAPRAPAIEGRKLTFTGITGVLKPGENRRFTLTVRATTPGEKLVIAETTCDQIRTPIRDDELTNFVGK